MGEVGAPRRMAEIRKRNRVKVIVRQDDEAAAAAAPFTSSSSPASAACWRGRWPSVLHTEQKEQCLGQPRTVCTVAQRYLFFGRRSQRACPNASGGKCPPA